MQLVQETIGTIALPVMRPVLDHNPYIGLGHTAYHHVGDTFDSAVNMASYAAIGVAAFHGYRRNRSVGWAIAWAAAAAVAPLITTGVAFAQGLGKRA